MSSTAPESVRRGVTIRGGAFIEVTPYLLIASRFEWASPVVADPIFGVRFVLESGAGS